MKRKKTNLSKPVTLTIGFVACLVLMLGILLAGPTNTANAEAAPPVETLEVAFNKTELGDSLATLFEFADETAKTLKVPEGANYTATLEEVSRKGQMITLWRKDDASFPWSRVEERTIEKNVAYCIRVSFAPKAGYTLSDDTEVLRKKLKVTGAELGKGKDIEFWDTAGQNHTTTAVQMDFVLSKGMTYIGYAQTVYPKIGVEVTGKIGTLYTDTGIWLRGAPGPYTYEIKDAPVGTEIQTGNVFEESTCYYRITAVNAMDGGTMYITATAADGQTCDIPVVIYQTEGGHEHTWSDFAKIDFGHHGYTKCTDPACPGVSPTFDKGAGYESHDFYDGCNARCKKCGDLGTPEPKHTFTPQPHESDSAYHVNRCACGEVEKAADGTVIEARHSGGTATCLAGARCEVCGLEYIAATGHNYEFKSFTNNDGTFKHLGFCRDCGYENTELRHDPYGGTATCQSRAVCAAEYDGSVCGCPYGDFAPHDFVDGICTKCSSDEYIREVEIDVPNYVVGMAYKPLFYPTVIKGNLVDPGIFWHKAAYTRNTNSSYLCGPPDTFETTYVTENSVMCYAFRPQTNCKLPESVDDIRVSVTRGEVMSKMIRGDGCLIVNVLLRVDKVVQSVDIDFSQPLTDNPAEMLNITEKNGYEFTVRSIGPLSDGRIIFNTPVEIELTVKAPEGKLFQSQKVGVTFADWLCDVNIPAGSHIQAQSLSDDLTEFTITIQTPRPIDCPHETVVLEAGRLETCTEDGIKDKYACAGCGKEFFDAACTQVWYDAIAILPKGHLLTFHDETSCSEGRDGNVAYYECRREACGKFFSDYACTQEIPPAETVVHDFKADWSSNLGGHYHECKNCEVIRDETAHRPDRTEATEDDPVACLDCGYIITPALAHTHRTALVPAVEPTCRKEGSRAYYRCSGCEVKFEDAEATRPVTDESTLALPKAHSFGAWKDEVPATAETEGVRGHKDCVFCEKHFDENGTELIDLTIAKLQKVEVTVAGGTGSGSYTEGDRVTVVADEPEEGKVFKGWQDAAGNLVSSDREYTFVAGGETRLTAVYENKPSGGGTGGEPSDPKDAPPVKTPEKEKEGLSGGAVAGIVVGSLAVVGLGGFSLFWFVMKKKTFAELLTAIRGIFAKK